MSDKSDLTPFARTQALCAPILAMIEEAAKQEDRPDVFLTLLQSEIQRIPGASVAFASRSIDWLREHSYLEDRGEIDEETLQNALCEAAAKFEEGYATEDGITYAMEEYLDRFHPRKDEDAEEGEEEQGAE